MTQAPPAPKIESASPAGEEPLRLPPTVEINKLSDKFREALGREEKPVEKPVEKPAEPAKAKPAEKPEAPSAKQDKPDSKEAKIPREHFKVLETQRDEFKTKWEQESARVKEYEAKVKEAEARIPADYEQLKEKLTKHEELAQKFYVEHSPQFKAAFDDKIAAGVEEAKEAVGAEKAERIADLLALPPSAKRDTEIDEITDGLSAFRQAALVKAFSEVRRLQKERASELSKSSENFKHLKDVEAQQSSRSRLDRQEALERALKITASEASKQSVHFQKIDGNEEHNQRVLENEKMLKEFTTHNLRPDDHAKLSMWAVRGIRSAQTDALKDALIQKLQAELKEIQDAAPSLDGGGKGAGGAKPTTAAEKYKKAMAEGVPES